MYNQSYPARCLDRAVRKGMNPVRERISEKVSVSTESGCWLWTGAVNGNGYPSIRVAGRQVQANRAAFEAFTGQSPGSFCVCHRCDNPLCVNPDHLFLGTNAANTADMVAKGRKASQRGETNSHAKLTDDAVREIRVAYASGGESQSALGRRFGVSKQAVWLVIHNRQWAHVEPLNA